MLVLVVLHQLHLADALRGAVPEHLGEHADFETPVARDAIDAHEVRGHRALAGERVAERVEVIEQRQWAEHRLHRAQQRRHEEPRDAPVEAIRDAPVVALRELVVEVRVHGREAEASQQFARVVADVAVVHRDDVGFLGRQHVPVGQPGGATLAPLARDRGLRRAAAPGSRAGADRRSRAASRRGRRAWARPRRPRASRRSPRGARRRRRRPPPGGGTARRAGSR